MPSSSTSLSSDPGARRAGRHLAPANPIGECGAAGTAAARLRLYAGAFIHAPSGLAIVDGDGRVVLANQALCVMAGLAAGDVVGRRLDDLLEQPPDPARLLAGEAIPESATCRLRHTEDDERWVQATAALLAADGDQPPTLVYQLVDVTERQRHQRELQYLVDHDGLTGLFNRRRFEQELDLELARHARSRAGGAVLMLDLDGFKAINDEFGHAVGNQLLCEIAAALSERCRSSDVVAHLSGDEFAVLVSGASRTDAERVAAALVSAVAARPILVGSRRAEVSASVGVVMFGSHVAADLLKLADGAMYAAKAHGRSRFVVFDSSDAGSNALALDSGGHGQAA